MNFFYTFIFALFVSGAAVGQTIQLLTPVGDAPVLRDNLTQPSTQYIFPNLQSGASYSTSGPTYPFANELTPADAGTNQYRYRYGFSNVDRYIYVTRINNKWTMKAHINITGTGAEHASNVYTYETVDTYNTIDPPCNALYNYIVGAGNPSQGIYALEFSIPCVNTGGILCNTEMHPKLINLAGVSATTFNTLADSSGLRMGSLVYNYSQQQAKYYDGIKWNEIYSPSNNLQLEPSKIITFKDATSAPNNLTLSKNSLNQLAVNKGISAFGNSNINGNLAVTGNLTAESFTNTGATTLSSLTVTGALNAQSGINVTGNSSVSGNSTVIGNSAITGNSTITGTATTQGAINQKVVVRTFSGGGVIHSFPEASSVIVVNLSNSSINFTSAFANFPTAAVAGSGRTYTVKNQSGVYNLIMTGATILVSGSTVFSNLTPGTSITFISDGTNWIKLD